MFGATWERERVEGSYMPHHSQYSHTAMETPAASAVLAGNSAALRVLHVSELVDIIFNFSNCSDNARYARVCKTWSTISLKIIWEEVDDLVALFSILSPMFAGNKPEHHNVYVPSTAAWRRFETYANLVRKLVYTPTYPSKKRIARAVLRDIGQTRIRLDIFPNMHHLIWIPALHDSITSSITPIPTDGYLFMHAGVKHVEFFLHKSVAPSRTKHFLDDIPLRAPLLTGLRIRGTTGVSAIEESIRRLAASLTSLQNISLPEGYLTTRIAEALSALPVLRRIQIGVDADDLPLDLREQPANFAPVIPAGRFTALEKLEVSIVFSDAVKVLDKVTSENGLRHLSVESQSSSCEDMQRVLDICAQKHKNLRELLLSGNADILAPNTPLTLQTIHSVKDLSALRVLNIEHTSAIFLSPADLSSILSSLPRLVELVLNDSPWYCEIASFGLDVIPVIAGSCRELIKLALFLDATIPLPDADSYPTEVAFAKLMQLHLGTSVITKEACHDVALYLSAHIPAKCGIWYGASWIELEDVVREGPHGERIRTAKERVNLWEEVESLVLFAEKVRIQERGRVEVS
ncbi:hypothetical protein D9619_013302 [Psilocybe cf. subviscida]|uniref:F-box domain-containing protein n=1 Tax=Psilocybe cf. subviscida TaxID=2480587 RepID=A0A8H5F9S1_9AGAR|nr:hypothetical protein D9619_013302 [Psilocybe cf. subviscida]